MEMSIFRHHALSHDHKCPNCWQQTCQEFTTTWVLSFVFKTVWGNDLRGTQSDEDCWGNDLRGTRSDEDCWGNGLRGTRSEGDCWGNKRDLKWRQLLGKMNRRRLLGKWLKGDPKQTCKLACKCSATAGVIWLCNENTFLLQIWSLVQPF